MYQRLAFPAQLANLAITTRWSVAVTTEINLPRFRTSIAALLGMTSRGRRKHAFRRPKHHFVETRSCRNCILLAFKKHCSSVVQISNRSLANVGLWACTVIITVSENELYKSLSTFIILTHFCWVLLSFPYMFDFVIPHYVTYKAPWTLKSWIFW